MVGLDRPARDCDYSRLLPHRKISMRCTDRTIVWRLCGAFAGRALLIVIEHEQSHRP